MFELDSGKAKVGGNGAVLLLTMPWAPAAEPSLGCAILKSCLNEAGVETDVYHASMSFLNFLKPATYSWVADEWAANDFVFAGNLDLSALEDKKYRLASMFADNRDIELLDFRSRQDHNEKIEKLVQIRDIVPQFFAFLLEEIDFSKYTMVGFSCLFDQTIASISFSRFLKERFPHLVCAFGGYALQSPGGEALQRAFPAEMDIVANGDGEACIVKLVEAVLGKRPLDEVPGISYFSTENELRIVKSEKIDLNSTPTPCFDDFFRQVDRMKSEYGIEFRVPMLPYETSRGCWWGQKSHCVFCGIDDETMIYRAKSADRAESQLLELSSKYGVYSYRFSDYIMPRQYLKTLLPSLKEKGSKFELHFETKSNMTADEIKLCAEAGVAYFQPGIESFSTPVLKLMKKGVRGMTNIVTMFNMARNGIHCFYNILYGFPGETSESYENLISLVPAISHLTPPQSVVPVLVTRFSPMHLRPELFGKPGHKMQASRHYEVVFSEDFQKENRFSNNDWVYYFENPYRDSFGDLQEYYNILHLQHVRWRERFRQGVSRLTYAIEGEEITFTDTRFQDEPNIRTFGRSLCGAARALPGCTWRRENAIEAIAVEAQCSKGEAEQAFQTLQSMKVLLEESGDFGWVAFSQLTDQQPADLRHRIAVASGAEEN